MRPVMPRGLGALVVLLSVGGAVTPEDAASNVAVAQSNVREVADLGIMAAMARLEREGWKGVEAPDERSLVEAVAEQRSENLDDISLHTAFKGAGAEWDQGNYGWALLYGAGAVVMTVDAASNFIPGAGQAKGAVKTGVKEGLEFGIKTALKEGGQEGLERLGREGAGELGELGLKGADSRVDELAEANAGLIEDFVQGNVDPNALKKIEAEAKKKGQVDWIDPNTDADKFVQLDDTKGILLTTDSPNKGLLAEELQHAKDRLADPELNAWKQTREQYPTPEAANYAWHAGVFDRVADAVESGADDVFNMFLNAADSAGFRGAADKARQLAKELSDLAD